MNKGADDMLDLVTELENTIRLWMVSAEAEAVTDVARLGWDSRAALPAGQLMVTAHTIIAYGASTSTLEYYSGLSYVDDADVSRVGQYTIWHSSSERVLEHLDIYWDRPRPEEQGCWPD